MVLYINRLNSVQIAIVQERMRCRPHRPSCFLGDEERLQDIILEDAQTLERLGVDYAQLARMLDSIISHPERHPEITSRPMDPPLECPFELGTVYLHSNQEFVVKDGSKAYVISGLMLHMIAAHQFFGGRQSPYRVEPGDIVRLLRLHQTGDMHAARSQSTAQP